MHLKRLISTPFFHIVVSTLIFAIIHVVFLALYCGGYGLTINGNLCRAAAAPTLAPSPLHNLITKICWAKVNKLSLP